MAVSEKAMEAKSVQDATDLERVVPNLRLETGEATAHTRIGWFRSVNNIPHAFAMQSMVAELAAELGQRVDDARAGLAHAGPEGRRQAHRAGADLVPAMGTQAVFMPVVALGFAVAPVAGQNFGARLGDRVRICGRLIDTTSGAPGSTTMGSWLKASGAPLCGSTQTASTGSVAVTVTERAPVARPELASS